MERATTTKSQDRARPDDSGDVRSEEVARSGDRPQRSGERPAWLPEGACYKALSPQTKAAITEIIEPAYEQLVLCTSSSMECSIGVSLVHLLWLEILDQLEGKSEAETWCALGGPKAQNQRLRRHIKTLDAKLRAGQFLQRIREFRDRGRDQHRPLECGDLSPLSSSATDGQHSFAAGLPTPPPA